MGGKWTFGNRLVSSQMRLKRDEKHVAKQLLMSETRQGILLKTSITEPAALAYVKIMIHGEETWLAQIAVSQTARRSTFEAGNTGEGLGYLLTFPYSRAVIRYRLLSFFLFIC